ncbi:PQQ-dependent sugar dehydrogenase [Vibrio paucivorans]
MRYIKRLSALTLSICASFNAFAWQAEKVSSGLIIPWGLAYVVQNTMLVTERNGVIKQLNIASGEHTPILQVSDVWAKGQGGLLDVALSPFDENTVYFTYSKDIDGDAATTLATAQYKNGTLSDWQDILITQSQSDGGRHFGSRIAFDEKYLYFTIGDRGERDNGQDRQTHSGTIVRLNPDGSTPTDNPFIKDSNALDEIWSFGHRNPQGIAYDAKTQRLWSIEHGPRGGDEINLIKKGANYGWPITSHGKEYWGPINVGEAKEKDGIESPVKVYVPSIAPGSLVIYQGDKFPSLKGKLLSGALKLTHINVVTLDADGNAVDEQRLLEDLGERIRDIEVAPDGNIFFSTDNGNVYRLTK